MTTPYDPHQIAHRIQYMLIREVNPEHRITVLEAVRLRFSWEGESIAETDESAEIDARLRQLGEPPQRG